MRTTPPGGRAAPAVLAGLALASLFAIGPPTALADHTDRSPLQCDGGWCADDEHHVLDCSAGHCTGDPTGFATIVNPSYEDGDGFLDDELVLGVDLGDTPRAYPIRYMNYFETIEETLGGEPVIITYCPLCGSGIVWSRDIGGETFTFPRQVLERAHVVEVDVGGVPLVAGFDGDGIHVYDRGTRTFEPAPNGTAQMFDGTGTRWDIASGRSADGERLERVPAKSLFWFAWLDFHPATGVLNATGAVIEPAPAGSGSGPMGGQDGSGGSGGISATETPWPGTIGVVVGLVAGLAVLGAVRARRGGPGRRS